MKIKFKPFEFKDKKGETISIRQAKVEDAAELLKLAIEISKTSKYTITTTNEFKKITLQQEKDWVESYKNSEDKIIILAVQKKAKKDVVLGCIDFTLSKSTKMKHVGQFGISVKTSHQGRGIGEVLLKALLSWINTNKKIKKIELQVIRENYPAVRLYEKLGFITEGVRFAAVFSDCKYYDLLQMSKSV